MKRRAGYPSAVTLPAPSLTISGIESSAIEIQDYFI
jgi:hypothetical protein